MRLLDLKAKESLLDLGCGSGVLARHLPPSVVYCGVDASKSLVQQARQQTKRPHCEWIVSDATKKLTLSQPFDKACFILSLQNMEKAQEALLNARRHLKSPGKLLIVLNHPAFRIPRQSDWGLDEKAKLQYRRMNVYMSSLKIPIQTNPGKGEHSSVTYSFHHPLSTYASWLKDAGFAIETMEEWCSDKKSEGSRARIEDRARKEFPLFLAILAIC